MRRYIEVAVAVTLAGLLAAAGCGKPSEPKAERDMAVEFSKLQATVEQHGKQLAELKTRIDQISAVKMQASAEPPAAPISPAETRRSAAPAGKISAFRIKSSSGQEWTVRNLDIDYTQYPSGPGFYTPRHIQSGLLVKEGEAEIEVPWQRIARVDIKTTRTYTVGWRDSSKVPDELTRTEHFGTESERNARWEELQRAGKFVPIVDVDFNVLATITFLSGDTRQGVRLKDGELEGEIDLGRFSGVRLKGTDEIVLVREPSS